MVSGLTETKTVWLGYEHTHIHDQTNKNEKNNIKDITKLNKSKPLFQLRIPQVSNDFLK